MSGTLYVVATPIGNLEDITLRALRVLGSVPILAAEDTRAARRLLSRHGLWPRPGLQLWSYFEGNEAARGGQLLEAMTQGHDVALISEAGMPGVSDPGMRLVRAAAEAGLRVEVLPGASAALCALVGSGLPTGRFLFLGFPPRPQGQRQALFSSLRSEPGTLILLEAPERTVRTLAELAQTLGPERPACVARELTKLHEEYLRAPLAELVRRLEQDPPRGEVTLVVAGAPPRTQPWDVGVDVEAEVRRRLASGERPREIAAALAPLAGCPRRQVYQLALALGGRSGPTKR